MQVNTPLAEAMGKYLDLTSDQMKLTAGNMANIDTPGYKTQGIDFEREFASREGTGRGRACRRRLHRMWMGWWRGRTGIRCRWTGRVWTWPRRRFSSGWACELLKHEFNTMSAIHMDSMSAIHATADAKWSVKESEV